MEHQLDFDQMEVSIFLQAAREGDVPSLQGRLDNSDVHIEVSDDSGNTALILASFAGHFLAVEFLLERGANINALDNHRRQTPLIYASRIGHAGIVKLLIDRGAEVNHADHQKHTALMKAAANGHASCVTLLVGVPALLNTVDVSGATPLMKASHIGSREVVSILIQANAVLSISDLNGNTALSKAAAGGHVECVQEILNHGTTAITRDILIKIMINWFPEMDRSEEQLKRDFECIRLLCQADVPVDERRVNVDVVDNHGDSLLMRTASIGHVQCAHFLCVDMCANVHVVNDSGQTAAMIAAKYGRPDILNLCLRQGADANVVDLAGYTAIMHAALHNHPSCVEAMTHYNADINVVDSDGWTPLMYMSLNGHLHCVNRLLALGALIDRKNSDGKTAFDLAMDENHKTIIEILRQHQGLSHQ